MKIIYNQILADNRTLGNIFILFLYIFGVTNGEFDVSFCCVNGLKEYLWLTFNNNKLKL